MLIYFLFIYLQGCVHKFTEELKQQLVIIFAVGLGFSVIQIFGMVLSCFLYFKLKGDDEWADNVSTKHRWAEIFALPGIYVENVKPNRQITKTGLTITKID